MNTFVPVWEGSIFQRYAIKFVKKNAWRVRRYWDFDDCMQEAAAVFARCCRYTDIDNPKWLMRIYSISLVNEFNTQAMITRHRYEAEHDFAQEHHIEGNDVDFNLGALTTVLSEASDELKTVLRTIVGAPGELIRLMLNSEESIGSGRTQSYSDAAWSRKLCRLSGIMKTKDGIVAELRSLLSPAKDDDEWADEVVSSVFKCAEQSWLKGK